MKRLLLMAITTAILVDTTFASSPIYPVVSALQPSLQSQIDEATDKFNADFERQGSASVAFGSFEDKTPGNNGPGLFQLFTNSLKARRIRIDAASPLKISGQIDLRNDELPNGTRLTEVVIDIRLSLDGRTINNHRITINDTAKLAEISGFTMKVNLLDQTKRDLQNELDRQLGIVEKDDEAKTNGDHNWVLNTDDGIQVDRDSQVYAQILVGSAAQKNPKMKIRLPDAGSNFPYVPIGVGEAYTVRITNNSNDPIGVIMKIDGIDRFQFSDDRDAKSNPLYRYTVIGAGKSGNISGWHITSDSNRDDNVLRFSVTKYGETAQAALGNNDPKKRGLITLAFCRAVLQPRATESPQRIIPPSRPQRQPKEIKSGSSGSYGQGAVKTMHAPNSSGSPSIQSSVLVDESNESPGTGFGEEIPVNQTPVSGTFEEPFEVLSIRYTNGT